MIKAILIHRVPIKTFDGMKDFFTGLTFKLVRSKKSGKLYWRRWYGVMDKVDYGRFQPSRAIIEELALSNGLLILKRKERAAEWKFLRYNDGDLGSS